MAKVTTLKKEINDPSNGGKETLDASLPYVITVNLKGTADFLFHRWNCESVEAKGRAAKNSVAKKTDDLESYVYRNDGGELCIPGEYIRQAVIHAAKYRQDPRSPRKSAMDLHKAGVIALTNLCSLGQKEWDYLDKRRVVIQRSGVNRTRPAIKTGWEIECDLMINLPEYISQESLISVLNDAGRLIGLGDFRPTFGRFTVSGVRIKK